MRGLTGVAGVAALVAATMSGSATSANAQAVRPYRPAFDVQDYAITLDLPDTGSTIHADVVLTVTRTGQADSLLLDLLDLRVARVLVDDKAASFNQSSTTVAIALPKKRGAGATFRVDVEYGGRVTDGLIVRTDSAGRWTYFGDNWPDRARHWIPSIDHPSDKATVTWRVRAPANRTVVANGKLVRTRPAPGAGASGRLEWEWRESRAIPVYLMVIAAAPLTMYDLGDTACGLAEVQRCVPQQVYTAPEQKSHLPGNFAQAPEIVRTFSSLVGPFPYEKLSHLQSSTRFGGMENASEIYYSDGSFRRGAGTPNEGTIAHETAHQWFGDAVTERDWSHVWLSEGFATYFAALWTRAAHGDSAFVRDMARIRATILADTSSVTKRPVIDSVETDYMALLNRNSYEKGGFFLHMLRLRIGEAAFFHALRNYYTKFHHKTAVTDDLMAEMERASGQKLRPFFDQWLRKPGYPQVTASWSFDAAAHEAVITVRNGPRFGGYEFPLTIGVVDSAGAMRRVTVQMTASGDAPPVRVAMPAEPARVVLDPDVALLATLTVVRQ